MTDGATIARRPVTVDDDGFLRRLYGTTRAHELAGIGWGDEQIDAFVTMQWQAQRLDYSARYPQARHDIVVADAVDVGRIWVDRQPGRIHLIDLALLPAWCGRGIGTALLTDLRGDAAADGSTIRHSVAKDNVGALRLYRRLGYEIVEDLEFHHVMQWSPTAG